MNKTDDLCRRLSSGRQNKCSYAAFFFHSGTSLFKTWHHADITDVDLVRYAQASLWPTVSSVITYLHCFHLPGGRLQAGAFSFYNVTVPLLIWTESSCCCLSRLNGQFDPIMSSWCLIGHHTHIHTHISPAQICPNINFTDKRAAIGKKLMLPNFDAMAAHI